MRDEIEQLGRELEANRKTVSARVADLKANSPIFAERSPFESDAEFLERTAAGKKQIDRLRKQYLQDIEARIQDLLAMRAVLATAVADCDGHGAVDGCPIIDAIQTRPASTDHTDGV